METRARANFFGCQTTPLIVGQAQFLTAQLLSKDTDLLDEALDHPLLLAVNPAGDREKSGTDRSWIG